VYDWLLSLLFIFSTKEWVCIIEYRKQGETASATCDICIYYCKYLAVLYESIKHEISVIYLRRK
jgi:hypothetical protein